MSDYGQFNRNKRQCEHCEEMRGRQYDKVMAWGSVIIGIQIIALIATVIVAQWRMYDRHAHQRPTVSNSR